MALNRDDLKAVRQRKYLGKDFDSLRSQLLEYVRLYYPDKIRDFSEASLGGMFLDLASMAGDSLSFYLDHQFGELDPSTAVEDANIQNALRSAGVPITGASPAVVPVTAYVQVPATVVRNVNGPDVTALPIIKANTIFSSDSGVEFILLEDIDFTSKRSDGTYYADIRIGQKLADGTPTSFIMALAGMCISGKVITENISLPSTFVPFNKITLTNPDVSDIVQVNDGLGNIYYQVNDLTNDVVYRNVINTAKDNELVPDALKIIPAPFRFTAGVDLTTRKTTLTMGGGNANTLEDDIIPDPSDFAISFPYTRTFDRIPVDPSKLLTTKTLGVSATNTTLAVTYRYGGGLSHNVPNDNIRTVKTLVAFFPNNPSANVAAQVKNSIEVSNLMRASGGEDAPSSDELKALIPSMRNSQERIVTRPDLLARVYTIPSNFGRVFRASVRSNPNNPLASRLYIVSRTPENQLITSPDTLKQNLIKYLNPYRMISDAIDILDARIVNISFSFDVLIDPSLNRSIVLQNVLTKLQSTFDIKNFHIDQPIIVDNVLTVIRNTPGVISINSWKFGNLTGINGQRTYSDVTYDIDTNTNMGIVFPPTGGIFECRFPQYDIIGRASV